MGGAFHAQRPGLEMPLQGSSQVLQERTKRMHRQADNHIRGARTFDALC